MNRRFELTDQEWERLAPLLPAMTPRRGGRWRDHRQVLNGILFRTRTGVPWRDVPDRYGPWETLYKRGSRAGRPTAPGPASRRACTLRRTGLGSWTGRPRSTPAWSGRTSTPPGPARGLTSIQASRQQALGRSRGGLTTKVHTVCDGWGRNLATRLTPGQDADTSELVGLVDAVGVARPGGRGGPARGWRI